MSDQAGTYFAKIILQNRDHFELFELGIDIDIKPSPNNYGTPSIFFQRRWS